ncbi:MAG: acyltransferase [Mesorhizobium sp.]|uniref:acyltransferase n=1 Tax=Mesorhizobium sp. TaxID=1871066 RepID=UPI000FE90CE9|nr:acyltransferase [Mesorhizobium sp.]RWC35144.1 MAG: acyltransferase [Mesorhizobium sp.]
MNDLFAHLKGFLIRWTCPLHFKRVGPGTTFHGRVRFPLPFRNIIIGRECMIGDSAFFYTGRRSNIFIGNHCSVNSGCHIVASECITIGDNVAIAEYVSIRDQEHRFSTISGVRGQGFNVASVLIHSNVWIGRGVYIGPGVTIESGTIVAANSVVRRGHYPPNVLLAGAPAVVKKYLDGADAELSNGGPITMPRLSPMG